MPLTELRPDYAAHGPTAAPHVRNAEIVRRAGLVLVVWDGRSKGTLSAQLQYKCDNDLRSSFGVILKAAEPSRMIEQMSSVAYSMTPAVLGLKVKNELLIRPDDLFSNQQPVS